MIISDGIWTTRSIDDQPEMWLARWSIWEVGTDTAVTRHFVGYNLIENEGRASSAIVEFDSKALRGRTKSGRIYELIGPAGHDADGAYVFAHWLQLNNKNSHLEITSKVLNPE